MGVRKTFKYRLYPTPAQETVMNTALDECRWLYNHFVEERKATYEQTGTSPSLYDQQAALPALKQERPSLAMVHRQVLQNVAVRVDLGFKAFSRRVRAGEKDPGYPRSCHLVLPRDVNAARNMLRLGLQSLQEAQKL